MVGLRKMKRCTNSDLNSNYYHLCAEAVDCIIYVHVQLCVYNAILNNLGLLHVFCHKKNKQTIEQEENRN